ncbi:hypothetical protein [Shewanella holmiensis]|uniref:HEPN domain-containing protein n=1 Tax=Shewanella holmiensis TaxID=2952222 RepID=A0A9X2WQF8_9GAMM|nr:hypothetical protein [Shewanella holmiensis]MCT7943633.1 hypothetical protein [Shewanella holmiensis]
MKYVGDILEGLAVGNSNPINSNLLGRSAFNRYYYASYLITRDMLEELEPKWARTSHANIPLTLRETIRAPVKKILRNQLEKGLISFTQQSKLWSSLRIESEALAELLEQAYDLRVRADYKPEELITRSGDVIMLGGNKLATARAWPDRTSAHCKSIIKVWKEVGLA